MSHAELPALNSLVDVVLLDGQLFPSRVEDADGGRLQVSAPIGVHAADMPKVGSALELGWAANRRRLAVDVRLLAIGTGHPPLWELSAIGAPRPQTRRNFVRGGGGETVELVIGKAAYPGRVVDVSEGGVRCRIFDDRFDRDDRVEVRLSLDGLEVTLDGEVLFVRRQPENGSFDVIVLYRPDESMAQDIRSYVLRREMEQRRRWRERAA